MENKNADNEARDSRLRSEGTKVERDVNTGGGDFIGRDNIINIGSLKIPRAIAPIIVIALVSGLAWIGFIAFNTFAITGAVTAPTPTATETVPTAIPTLTPHRDSLSLRDRRTQRNLNFTCHVPQHGSD